MASHKGSHLGSFAKGFSDSLLAVMRMSMMMDYYKSREQYLADHERHWKAMEEIARMKAGKGMGMDADTKAAYNRSASGWGGGDQPSHPATGAWWTPERMDHAVNRLENEAGLSHAGAAGLVARWSGVEAPGGPGSSNNLGGGHWGIGQWGIDRGGRDLANASFDGQLTHAINELNGSEKAAGDALRRASTPEEAARGASMYERAEGYNASTGTDNFTARTPVQRVMAAVNKPTTVADTATPVKPGTEKTKIGPTGGPDARTSTGEVVHTDAEGRAIDPKTGRPTQTSQAEGTPYQVAGPMEGLTEEQAQKARADLEAHRVSPETQALVGGREPPVTQGAMATARRGDTPPPPTDRTPISAIPPGPKVAAQDDAFQPPFESGFPYQADPRMPPRTPTPPTGYAPPYRPEDSPRYAVAPDAPARPVTLTPPPPGQGPVDPSIIARQKRLAAQQAAMPARPTSQPYPPPFESGYPGPSQPARPVTPTPYVLPPQMGPEGVNRPNPRVADINAPVVGGDERLQPAENADAPAPNAQTVSAPAGGPAISPTPRVTSDPRFTQIDRPDVDPTQRARMGNPQMTALDLSHLFGPNPPVAQRQAAAAPQPGPDRTTLPARVAANPPLPPPRPDDLGSDVATASRKGGPIQRFNRGGIPQRSTMKFQGGGAPNTVAWKPTTSPTPYTTFQPAAGQPLPTVQPPLMGSATPPTPGSANATTYAGFQPWGNGLQWLASQPTSQYTNPMMFTGQQIGDDLNALPTGQQQWYNEQMANKMAQGTSQWYYNPASLPAAPAAAAATPTATALAPTIINPPSVQNITNMPAPINDPTTQTTTGTPGVPNIVTAKSYDPNVDAQTGAGFANTANTGGTNYSVGSNDLLQQNNQGQISGVRKGGAIPSRPAMKYAAAGAVSPNPVIAAMYAGTYTGPGSEGSWVGTPYAQLAPNQQAWADQQKNIWGQINAAGAQDAAYWSGGGTSMTGPVDTSQLANQLSLMPGAIWPTANAAPTPLNEPPPSAQNITAPQVDVTGLDPTTTTTTGTPGVPNIIQAKSYDPNVDQQTGATFANTSNVGGTNYSVGSTDALQTTDQNTITGSRRGGPITPRVRYDDGGGVSPSIAGMPPGLSQQGASPIPPIYFNPATYAGAGAPVGKGVSATSAPTYVAGAIPSLPMFKGGAVRFQGGGDVSAGDDMAGMQQVASDDMMDRQADAEDQQELAGMNASPAAGAEPSMLTPADFQAQPAAPMTPAQQIMPEIHDGQGNPSRGLIGALAAGMHWLGDHLGLVSGAQAQPAIATDPQTQSNRRNFASRQNVGGMDQATYEGFADLQDPHHQLEAGERHIAGMEGAYKWLLSQGREKEAGPIMASMLQYSVMLSQNYSEQAAKELYDGNLKGAVDNINDAVRAIPDGRNIHAELSPDGKTVTVTGTDITDGRVLWQRHGAAQAILEHATALGRDGKLAWDAVESQVAKYDPPSALAVKNRQANEIAAGKERADREAQAQANAQIAALGSPYGEPVQTAPANTPGALPGPGQPPAPVMTASSPESAAVTPSTPATQPTQDGSGSAPSHPPPATADSRLDAQAPAPQAQDVDLEHNVAYQNIVANTRPKYKTADGDPIVGGRAMVKPPVLNAVTAKAYAPQVIAAINERWRQYNETQAQTDKLMQADIDGQRRDMALDVQGRRTAQTQEHSDVAAAERDRLTAERQKGEKTFEWEHTAPAERFKETPPAGFLAGSSFTAANKADGTADTSTSAQNLGKMFDRDDRGGIPRVQQLSSALWNTQGYNTERGPQQLGDIMVGMANGTYGYRSKVGADGLREVQVFPGKVGEGEPVTLKMDPADVANIDRIKAKFQPAPAQQPGPAIPNAPQAAAPPLTQPSFFSGTRGQGPGSYTPALRLPEHFGERVSPEQMPPEQRSLYPELNQ